MKKLITILIAGLTAAVLTACGSGKEEAQQNAVHKITSEEAQKMMEEGDVTVVDVRTQEEYEEGHVPGAVLIPNETIGDEDIAKLPHKDAVILVYCRSGRRSAEAAGRLSKLGYENIYDFGGIIDWPYDVEK